jgi:uncharacterized OsmC-like protein
MQPGIGERQREDAMSQNHSLNQVNLQAVGALVEEIQRQPALAKTLWRSDVRWQGAFRSEARSRDLRPVPSDEPATLGGGDTAANPVEQLLGALGNCLVVGYAANATLANIRILSLNITLEGGIDLHTFLGLGTGNAGFESIRAKVDLKTDATPERTKELHRKVVATSPVGHTLSRAVPVEIDLL